jgi:hypothetical protein
MSGAHLVAVHAGVCLSPQSCVMAGLDTFWGSLADGIRQAAGEAVTFLFSWWAGTGSTPVDTAVVHTAQRFATVWIAVPVAVLAVLAVIVWTVGTGNPAWIRDLARGLLVFGVTAAGSIPMVSALQRWMDGLAEGLLAAVPTGDVGRRLIEDLTLPGVDSTQVAFWGLIVFLVSLVQYVLGVFRDGAVLILTVVLPVAAAGQFSRGSLLWLPKVTGWLLAFLMYKPAAALIYYVGFSLVGRSSDVRSLATGLCLMVTVVLALPALLRLVTFAVASPYPSGTALSGAATATGITTSIAQLTGRRGAATGAITAAPTGAAVPVAGAATAAVGAASAAKSAVSKTVTPKGSTP